MQCETTSVTMNDAVSPLQGNFTQVEDKEDCPCRSDPGADLGKGKGTVHQWEQNIPPARGQPLKKAKRIVAYGIRQKLRTPKAEGLLGHTRNYGF